jgi:flagellar hook-length control protein FliK
MLLSINLPGTELSAFQGELPAAPALPADAARPVAGFAELLGLNFLSSGLAPPADSAGPLLDDDGEALPDDGNALPLSGLPESARDLAVSAATAGLPGATLPATSQGITPADVSGQDVPADGAPVSALRRRGSQGEGLDLFRTDAQRQNLRPATHAIAARPETGHAPFVGLPFDGELPALIGPRPMSPGSRFAAAGMDLDAVLPVDGDAEAGSPLPRQATAGAAARADSLRQLFDAVTAQKKTGFGPDARQSGAASPADATANAPAAEPVQRISLTPASPALQIAPAIPALAGGAPVNGPPATAAQAASLPRIDVPLQDPNWSNVLNERVTFMAGKDLRSAEIRLNPAELGPIHVQLSVDDRGTSVTFAAHHALTRDAIEQALPRLRELFSDQGLSLGQASVSDQGVKQDRDGYGGDAADWQNADGIADETDELPVLRRSSGSGQVDTFA